MNKKNSAGRGVLKSNKKGFTLIELLAVIVILAIVALIAVPIVLKLIERSKVGSAKASAESYIKAVSTYVVTSNIDKSKLKLVQNHKYDINKELVIDDNIYKITNLMDLKGSKPTGIDDYIILDEKNKIKEGLLTINGYEIIIENDKILSVEKSNTQDSKVTGIISKVSSIPYREVNGYYKEETLRVDFSKINITNGSYYIKSTRSGNIESTNLQVCGNETTPSECGKTSSITAIQPNTWYKLIDTKKINVTYNEQTNESGTLYAVIYDGNEYVTSGTYKVSKIDRIAPTDVIINVESKTDGKVDITVSAKDGQSGISKYVIYYGTNVDTLTSTKEITKEEISLALKKGETYYFKVRAYDKVGNYVDSNITNEIKTCTWYTSYYSSYTYGVTTSSYYTTEVLYRTDTLYSTSYLTTNNGSSVTTQVMSFPQTHKCFYLESRAFTTQWKCTYAFCGWSSTVAAPLGPAWYCGVSLSTSISRGSQKIDSTFTSSWYDIYLKAASSVTIYKLTYNGTSNLSPYLKSVTGSYIVGSGRFSTRTYYAFADSISIGTDLYNPLFNPWITGKVLTFSSAHYSFYSILTTGTTTYSTGTNMVSTGETNKLTSTNITTSYLTTYSSDSTCR